MTRHLTYRDFVPLFQQASRNGKGDNIAMSPDTDPFAIGTTTRHEAWAMWFADLFLRFNLPQGVHLRRIHYVLVSQEQPVAMVGSSAQNYAVSDVWVVPAQGKRKAGQQVGDVRPNVYENTQDCWQRLVVASSWARWLGLVDANAFTDQRNPDPVLFDDGYKVGAPTPRWALDGFDFDRSEAASYDPITFLAPDAPEIPQLFSTGISHAHATKTHVVEVWIEKSTMNAELLPICRRYGVNLVAGVGETSITAIHALAQRLLRYGKPARILYISDFDPAGCSMPMAAARKLEAVIREECPELEDLGVTVERLLLTKEQVDQYRLPPVPLKETEARADKFRERHDIEGGVELDALEALHPGEFSHIVEEAIQGYRAADEGYLEALDELESEMDSRAGDLNDTIQEQFGDVVDDLAGDFDALVERYRAITEKLEQRFDRERRAWLAQARPVFDQIREAVLDDLPDVSDLETPEPEPVVNEDALFNSERSYLHQVQRFQAYREGQPFDLDV